MASIGQYELRIQDFTKDAIASGRSGTYGYRLSDPQGAVKVQNLAKVRKQLKDFGDDIDYRAMEFLPTNKAIAAEVAKDARAYIPIRTGNLAASVREAATKTSARVKAGGGLSKAQRAIVGGYSAGVGSVEYAGPIHFGWPARRIKPQPFFYEAIDKRRVEIARRYTELVEKLIKKYDLNP